MDANNPAGRGPARTQEGDGHCLLVHLGNSSVYWALLVSSEPYSHESCLSSSPKDSVLCLGVLIPK